MASTFRGALEFFEQLGVYDVVLPFLLVFTIVFAILDKSKLLGTMHVNGQEYANKNLNAMVAFVIGFLVVLSAQLVAVINQAIAHVVLLLILLFMFLLLAASFHKQGEFELDGAWKKFFMLVVFIAIVAIFLNAMGWLTAFSGYMTSNWDSVSVSGIILIAFVILIMYFITRSPAKVAGDGGKT